MPETLHLEVGPKEPVDRGGSPTATSWQQALTLDSTYEFQVRAVDNAGRVSTMASPNRSATS